MSDNPIPDTALVSILDAIHKANIEGNEIRSIAVGRPEGPYGDLPEALWGFPIAWSLYLAPGRWMLNFEERPAPTSILDEAKAIVEGKARDYGEPAINAGRIAEFWDLYLTQKYGAEDGWTLDAGDVCAMMRLLKECRQINSFGRDNLTDIAGWAAVQDAATR